MYAVYHVDITKNLTPRSYKLNIILSNSDLEIQNVVFLRLRVTERTKSELINFLMTINVASHTKMHQKISISDIITKLPFRFRIAGIFGKLPSIKMGR